ncbi:MAG TPA: glycoside hydrolase family 3 N-terminal domain-containing protein, partial [Thermoanaerobaculales bacterium]|nr:glycoside hydrolase family 3 N-terminal domain-containing protein [Thermoanaerobaculales bacterium]
MRIDEAPLIVGLPGTSLDAGQCGVLAGVRPTGVILFARNIVSAEQVRELGAALDDLEPRPFVAIDLEGGAVNRLAGLWGTLPSPAAAAAVGRRAVRALGEAAGAGCRALGIHLDLAPVIDLDCGEGFIPAQGRCLSASPERVATLARVFNEGLASWGVAGCLKHFPGLGAIAADTHAELPVIPPLDQGRHIEAFAALSEDIPIVMVGHAVAPGLGDPDRPATLAPSAVAKAISLPGSPVVLSDDLEMGALSGLGDLPDLVVDALRARNHGVLVCKAFDRLPEIIGRIEDAMASDSAFRMRLTETTARLGTLRRDLCRSMAAVPM